MTTTKNYVWMLKSRITGDIQPTYTYKSRASARKAIRSTSGRFQNYYPVKVFQTPVSKTTGKISTTKQSFKSTKSTLMGKTNWRMGIR